MSTWNFLGLTGMLGSQVFLAWTQHLWSSLVVTSILVSSTSPFLAFGDAGPTTVARAEHQPWKQWLCFLGYPQTAWAKCAGNSFCPGLPRPGLFSGILKNLPGRNILTVESARTAGPHSPVKACLFFTFNVAFVRKLVHAFT